jgi:glycosyltransferase involved in cell wall biosynthesis
MCAEKRLDGLVSVIIPTYNYARFLPEALESAQSQQGVDLEVIVVDDGSTDETQDVLSMYQSGLQGNLRVLHQDNQGLSAARNAGINLARGEFLVFLDATQYVEDQRGFGHSCLSQPLF